MWIMKLKQTVKEKQQGALLLEIVLAIALATLLIPAFVSGIISSTQGEVQIRQRTKATLLLKEAEEAVKVVREKGWDAFVPDGTYHPEIVSGSWSLILDAETIDGFYRQIEILPVYRNENGVIVQAGGSIDPSSKLIRTTISWSDPYSSSTSNEIYITRYLDNMTLTETTEAEFDLGILNGAVIVNTEGGEIQLSGGGRGDWCAPNEWIVEELDLTHDGRSRAINAIEGRVFTGSDSYSSGVFHDIEISNENPPHASITDTIDGYDTNDIFIDEDYAYVATDDISRDVIIVDLSTGEEVGYYNDDYWWGTANGVWVEGDVGYATIGPKLHTFDLSSKTGERSEFDNVNLSPYWFWPATGYDVEVVGNYAFVALDFGISEFRIVDVTDPNNISRDGYANLNSKRGKQLSVNETGTRVYMATDRDSSKDEFFIINTESKSGSLPVIGSYDADGMNPRGITVGTSNKVILVGLDAEESQVIDIQDENNPERCGGIDVDDGIYGVDAILEEDGDAFSYIVTGDDDLEFKIIEGGPGGTTYTDVGTFESQIFDSIYSTAFNYSFSTWSLPGQTQGSYQIAVADAVNDNCSEAIYAYVGPDGTGNTYFENSGSLPADNDGSEYENPGRCFRYKIFLETDDITETPMFKDITINYSP